LHIYKELSRVGRGLEAAANIAQVSAKGLSIALSFSQPLMIEVIILLAVMVVAYLAVAAGSSTDSPGMVTTILRMLIYRGQRRSGVLTNVVFPINVADLVGENGPMYLTTMLRYGKHLPANVSVTSVRDTARDIRDGVKGDKAVIEVKYDSPTKLPSRFFVKFNLGSLKPVRLLMETSECCRCEALFFHHAFKSCPIPTPACYFTDYNDVTGEFVLVSEVVHFGEQPVLPLKHRIRDAASLPELLIMVRAGAGLNAAFWGESNLANVALPRFQHTHQRMWVLAQLIARFGGLHHTMARTLKGRKVCRTYAPTLTLCPSGHPSLTYSLPRVHR
jgi:hypothetical protein